MKNVYVAKCKTPFVCKETFESVIEHFPEKANVLLNTMVIRTEETIEAVRQKFEENQQPCNVLIYRTTTKDNDGKSYFEEILK